MLSLVQLLQELTALRSFIIDSLDSLLVFGLTEEFERARKWVKDLSFDIDDKFHNFEASSRPARGTMALIRVADHDSRAGRPSLCLSPLWERHDVPGEGSGPGGSLAARVRLGTSSCSRRKSLLTCLSIAALRNPLQLYQPPHAQGHS